MAPAHSAQGNGECLSGGVVQMNAGFIPDVVTGVTNFCASRGGTAYESHDDKCEGDEDSFRGNLANGRHLFFPPIIKMV